MPRDWLAFSSLFDSRPLLLCWTTLIITNQFSRGLIFLKAPSSQLLRLAMFFVFFFTMVSKLIDVNIISTIFRLTVILSSQIKLVILWID